MIPIKTPQEIKIMAEAGKILAEIMKEIKSAVKPGITTNELNKLAQELVFKSNTIPAFLGYDDFPAVLCTSINEVIVHGIPSEYVLKQGDILSLDLGIMYKGYFSDMAITMPVGEISIEAWQLIRAVKKSLSIAIKKARPGNTLGDVGNTIERYLEKRGLCVVKELCGHGIGRKLHEEPEILNYGKRKKGEELKQGMVLCLEPMAGIGIGKIKKAPDRYGLQTIDNSLSAHFEHTIAITSNGNRILTE
ncbi:type I methionyl aminopeptidase [Patescibacteria group bacterium]|nr:type I methionyl aminopeptidase [Patescibacteria group bacterium]MBU4162446.1 type I methionyl aminopeptidase [Patescibacteria group bacterium]